MGFNPPVPQQDSNWEIRIAVLLSLVLQVLLIFVAPVRRRSSSSIPRFIVWSSYLLADWVADLALGLMLNNLGNIGGGGSSSPISSLARRGPGGTTAESGTGSPIIFAFWAPFLLLHLGGPDTITAYSLADNELWIRHLVGLLFELSAAAVVFLCCLRSNHMIPATVLMFVTGIIKYGERTYSLYFACAVEPDPGPEYANRKIDIFGVPHAGTRRRHANVEELENLSVEAQGYELFTIFRFLYVNLILSFVNERKISHDFFMARKDSSEAFEVVEAQTNFLCDIKYTKAPVIHTKTGYALRFLCSCCIIASLVLFIHTDKGSILPVDVGITYALLIGAAVLDAAALAMLILSDWTMVFLERSRRFAWLAGTVRRIKLWRSRWWSETVKQMNLISYSLGRPDKGICLLSPSVLWRVVNAADMLGIRVIIEDLVFVRREPLSYRKQGWQKHLFDFIFERVKKMASKEDQSVEDIKKVCELRGTGVIDEKLKLQGQDIKLDIKLIQDSVTKDFDECLLLWHIATDLCLATQDPDLTEMEQGFGHEGGQTRQQSQLIVDMREISKCLSEYMLYLLIKRSDLLSAVAGIGLIRYRDTCTETRRIFDSIGVRNSDVLGHDVACRKLLSRHREAVKLPTEEGSEDEDREAVKLATKDTGNESNQSRSVLWDASNLAMELNKLDEETKWQVVTGVWGEMLTFVACRGRGSTHVQQLVRGGELITMVSKLMNNLGLGNMF